MLSAKFRRRRTAVVFSGVGSFAAAIIEAILISAGANVYFVELAIWVMMFMFGVAAPAAAAIVLDSQRNNAGTAAALLGALPFFLGSIAVSCTGFGSVSVSFASMIIIGGFLGALLSLVARHYQKNSGLVQFKLDAVRMVICWKVFRISPSSLEIFAAIFIPFSFIHCTRFRIYLNF